MKSSGSMAYKIEVSETADAEADEVFEWIAEHSPDDVVRWYQGLFEKFDTLQHNPQRCPLAVEDETLQVGVRELLYGKRRGVYRILYTVEGDIVRILHVRHAARRPLGEQE